MQKIYAYLLLFAVALSTACSKNDDPEPKSELELANDRMQKNIVQANVPAAMQRSQDPYAQQTAEYVSSMNEMAQSLAGFYPPPNARKSSEPIIIESSNGRATAASEYLVYYWSEGSEHYAYQFSQKNDAYVMEFFYRSSSQESYKPLIYAEIHTDGKWGTIKYMFSLEMEGEVLDSITFDYSWQTAADGTINYVYNWFGMYQIRTTVRPDKSGSMQVIFNEIPSYQVQWDAAGNGNWIQYDTDGTELERGSWRA